MFRATSISAVEGRGFTGGARVRGSGGHNGGRGVTQPVHSHGQCYAIPSRPEVEASNVVITGTSFVCFRSASILFNLRLTFSYVTVYFALGFDSVSEPLAMSIRVFTPVGDVLVVDRAYQSCVVTFARHETLVDLLILDMVNLMLF